MNRKNVRFFLRESAKRIIASGPMTIDNYLEASLPLENIKKRKMRNRMKKKIIDYQTNKEETTDWKICGQLSRDNCQLTKCPQDPIAF